MVIKKITYQWITNFEYTNTEKEVVHLYTGKIDQITHNEIYESIQSMMMLISEMIVIMTTMSDMFVSVLFCFMYQKK